MFVVIVARGVPSPRTPLWGIFELDQARALRAAGHRVAIAALDVRSVRRWRRFGMRHEVIAGIDVHTLSLPVGQVPSAVDQAVLDRAFDLVFTQIVTAHGIPDVVHAHFTKYALAAARSSRRRQFRLVVTEHNSKFNPSSIPFDLRLKATEAYRRADAVVAVSQALADVLTENFDVPVRVVPNIVDVATFAQLPREPHDGIRLVTAGNLLPRKRMVLLVDGFARAFADRPEATLTIIGDGPEREVIEAHAAEAGVSDRVRLLGQRTRAQIAAEFAACDGFVMLSEWETFGVVFIEAMASGLPVLASRCGGPEGFLHDDLGMFAQTDSVAALADSLTDFVSRFPQWEPGRIRAEVVARFAPERIAAELGEVYAQVTCR
ncbi:MULTISPECIES: glycosyltransferase [unclassified Luteococcus]|uniref:glycosyltransferase n=1 Tax=unclassified Luteococcus TaxID=2639923 RepID=UPI00313EEE9B